MCCEVQRYPFQAWLDQGAQVTMTDLLLLSVVFILKWLSPSWWPRWSRGSKFRYQTQQLDHMSFSSSAPPRSRIDFPWRSWGHMPMSDQ